MESTETPDNVPDKEIEKAFNALPFDIKAEVLVAHLIQQDMMEAKDVIINPQGTFSRAYRYDVLKIHKKTGKRPHYFLDIAREGLYDQLPEGLFHQSLNKGSRIGQIDTQASLQQIRVHREEEKAARKFFLPLEQEFFLQRIQLELIEKRYWKSLSHEDNHQLLASFWQFDRQCLSQDQASALSVLLPLAHRIAGNLSLTSQVFELMLGAPVQLKQVYAEETVLSNAHACHLGYAFLGKDTILGPGWDNGDPTLALEIGPVAADRLMDLMPEGEAQPMYALLFEYFIPAEVEVMPVLTVDRQEQAFRLTEDLFTSRLNYNTII